LRETRLLSTDDLVVLKYLDEPQYQEKLQVLAFAAQQEKKITDESLLMSYIGANNGTSPEASFIIPSSKYPLIMKRFTEYTANGVAARTYLTSLLEKYTKATTLAERTSILNGYFKVLRTIFSDPLDSQEDIKVLDPAGSGALVDTTAMWWEYDDTLLNRSLAGYFHSTEEKYG